MGLLAGIKTETNIQDEQDNLGGGRRIFETDIYKLNVSLAYLEQAKSGALALNVHFETEDGAEYRESFYVLSGKDKGNKNYYEKDGEKRYLPGFNMATSLCLLTCGKELNEMVEETKLVPLWNADAKKEVPTNVPVLTELLDKEIYGALFKKIENKQVQDAGGAYVDTAETRETNELDKFFRASDKLTTAEIRAEQSEPGFFNSWIEKWKGKVRDRSKKVDAGAQQAKGFGGASAAAGGTAKPAKKLFATG